MSRMNREQLNKLKKKLGVDTLWSYSRYSSYLTDPYGYYLNYVEHIQPEKTDSYYTVLGSIAHDILQDFYEGKIKREEMIDRWEDGLFEADTNGYKPTKDEDKSKLIKTNYEDSIRHFYLNYIPLKENILCEKFLLIRVKDFYLQGYVDYTYKTKDGIIHIGDYKTSTLFKKDDLEHKSEQLKLYAIGIHDKFNVPYENIVCEFSFLKYCTVICDLKTIDKKTQKPKTKSKVCQRNKWINESAANIKTWLCAEYGFKKDSLELATAYQDIQNKNSLEDYPLVKKHFKLEDCYLQVEITEEEINELKERVADILTEINYKVKKTRELDDEREIDKLWWTEIDKGNEFYFKNLLGYNRQQHKPLDMYLKETEELFKVTKEQDDNFDW